MALHGGPERPFHEDVKAKPELSWRPRDVRDARVIGYLPSRAANWGWTSTREKCAAVNKDERSWRSEEGLDIRHGDMQSLLSWFPFLFGPAFSSLCSLSSLLEWQYVSCAIVCWKYVIWFFILIFQGLTIFWDCRLRRDCGLYTWLRLVDLGNFEIGLNDFCIMIWLQAMIWLPGMECGSLNESVPYSLMGGWYYWEVWPCWTRFDFHGRSVSLG